MAYTVPPPDRTDDVLAAIGYTKELYPFNWEQFSPLEKFETAYIAADRATAQGGRIMIAQAAEHLSHSNESATLLRDLIPSTGAPGVALRYSKLSGVLNPVDIPPQFRAQLIVLSDHSGSAIGGITGVLRDVFGLSNAQMLQVFHESSSREDALIRGFQYAQDPESALRKLVTEIEMHYPLAVYLNPEFNRFRPVSSAKVVPKRPIEIRVVPEKPPVPVRPPIRPKPTEEMEEGILKALQHLRLRL